MKISKKELEAIKKEIIRRNSAGDNTSVNKTYGPIAASAKPTPKPKPKGLNDFLKEGKTPPSKNKKGIPSDADVTLKGYNDKKTVTKKKR